MPKASVGRMIETHIDNVDYIATEEDADYVKRIAHQAKNIENLNDFIKFLEELTAYSSTSKTVLSPHYKDYVDAIWGYSMGHESDLECETKNGSIPLREVAMILFGSLSYE